MGVYDRLSFFLRSEFNARRKGNEHDATLAEVRKSVETLRREERTLVSRIKTLRTQAQKWEDRAALSLHAGDEELAREAIREKVAIEQSAESLREELDKVRHHLEEFAPFIDEEDVDSHRLEPRATRRPTLTNEVTSSLRQRFSSPTDSHSPRSRETHTRRSSSPTQSRRDEFTAAPSVKRRQSPFESRASHPPQDNYAQNPQSHFQLSGDDPFSAFESVSDSIQQREAAIQAEGELLGFGSSISELDPLFDPKKEELLSELSKLDAKAESNKSDDEIKRLKSLFSHDS